MTVIEKHAPLRTKRVKSAVLPGWLSPEIIDTMKKRDHLKNEYKALKKENSHSLSTDIQIEKHREIEQKQQEYKKLRNKVNELIRVSKKRHFNKMVAENRNTSSLWHAINSITQKPHRQPINLSWSPDSLNNHFVHLAESVGMASTLQSPSCYCPPPSLQTFCSSRITPGHSFKIPLLAVHEVGSLISKMVNKKSMGPDNISSSLLKLGLPYVVEHLTFIYNSCIEKNIVPPKLKTAKVIPLPKCKDLSDLNNFRPISILTVLSKPLERHVHKHLAHYLEVNDLFHPLQSGFRQNHSCQTALVRLCDQWLSAINQSKMTGAIFLDFKKAFDLVNHEILMKKLMLYLCDEKSVSFFASYLTDRTQFVYSNGTVSSTMVTKTGVPQGSVLGPLLFSLFINDLPLSVSDKNVLCDLFADDSSLHSSGASPTSIQTSLQTALTDISDWCDQNMMVIHPKKTKSMLIATRQRHQTKPLTLQLTLKDNAIEQVREHRVLGVIIDQELKWQAHIEKVSLKLARCLFLLKKLKPFLNENECKMFFHAHCLSHVNYASVLWDSAANCHLLKLNSIYKRAAKIMHPDQNLTTEEKFAKLNILSLHSQLDYNKAILMYKVHNDLAPKYLTSLVTPPIQRYGSSKYILPYTRIDKYKSSFAFSGSVVWNSLPPNVKLCSTISRFKKMLRANLTQNPP